MRQVLTSFKRYNIVSNHYGVGNNKPSIVFLEYEYKCDLSPMGILKLSNNGDQYSIEEYYRHLDRLLKRWNNPVSSYWLEKTPIANWFHKDSMTSQLEAFIAMHLCNLYERMDLEEFKQKHFLYDEAILFLYPMVVNSANESKDVLYQTLGIHNSSYEYKDLCFIQRLLGLSKQIKSFQSPVDKPLFCLIGKEFWQNSDKWELTKQILFPRVTFSNIVDGELQKCHSDDHSVLCFEEPTDINFINNKELTDIIECLTGDLTRFQ